MPLDAGELIVDAQPNSADMIDARLSPDGSNPDMKHDMRLQEPTGDCRENQTCHGEPCLTRDGRNGFMFAMSLFIVLNALKFRAA